MTPLAYCENKITLPGSSLYYSMLYCNDAQRQALIALHALAKEIQDIVYHCQEESVAKQKLAWWQQQIEKLYQQQADHPAAKALLPAISAFQIPQQLLLEYIDGVELMLNHSHCCSHQDQLLYCYRDAGIISIISAYINGPIEANVIKYAHELGTSLGLARMILELRQSVMSNHLYFAQDEMNKQHVDFEKLSQLTMHHTLQAFLKQQSQLARQHYQVALERLSSKQRQEQLQGIILGQLALTLLNEVEQDGFTILQEKTELTPFRKLWISWRMKRKIR